ncbi:hypothetical protein KUTeg_000305 [Tegillarca granosa]|uniref:Uncharacterized protein n=1 Tax=Tegillarca granosa TaxID=220873 RepID=A0ABQ9FX64_TEGGR|nr:hypothetical protein KUTeg_000305 [Tegillarca granosa]
MDQFKNLTQLKHTWCPRNSIHSTNTNRLFRNDHCPTKFYTKSCTALSKMLQRMDTTKEFHVSSSNEKMSENHLETQLENIECGIMGFRPKILSKFRNILTFSIISGFVGIMASVQTYFTSQIPHLEKQFGLNSAESGLIVAWSRIGYLIFNLFGSSSAQLLHIPLILFWFMVIYSVAGLCLTIPYFAMASEGILSRGLSTSNDNFTIKSSVQSKSNEYFFCDTSISNITGGVGIGCDVNIPEVSDAGSDVQQFKTMASVIFSLCLLVMGIMYASRFPYTTVFVDDNVNKLKTGFYIGFLYGIGIFGPAIAFTVGGATSKIYVTLEGSNKAVNSRSSLYHK